ncbi:MULTISPECIES: hypothetical protein [Niallia]|uniref:Uncharacterized protein n=1 Tax=Niallia circulans TaxID=1397 RepID=A0A941GJ80_NIACI|nr:MULTISPECIES: hypothetical protein [Niallia]MCB5237198.1 hypothetical protein [Niallia circulans]MED3795638.1 hypothetical protein [Niallia alba]
MYGKEGEEMAYDKPCKYCGKTVHINNNHIRLLGGKLAHIRCNEDNNSHKSYCNSCGGEIIIVHTYIVSRNIRIMKDGRLAKKSHSVDRIGEGTHAYNAHCEDCGEEYRFKEVNGIYTIEGKSY